MRLDLSLSLPTAVKPSPNVLRVAGMFGLGLDQERQLSIVPPVSVDLVGGQVVFITGPSGSGKSSLLRLIAAAADRPTVAQWRFDNLPALPRRALVDCFPKLPLEDVLSLLSLAGLGDAFVMLRRPDELSDGQRYRLRLAQVMAQIQVQRRTGPSVALDLVLADEFGATLDRLTAAVIARNLRKWVHQEPSVCFVAATTHDDLLEHLDPDVLIVKDLGTGIQVLTGGDREFLDDELWPKNTASTALS